MLQKIVIVNSFGHENDLILWQPYYSLDKNNILKILWYFFME